MNFAALRFIIISLLLLTVTACGGRNKPDRADEPVPSNEVAAAKEAAAASGPIAPTDPTTDPNSEVGAASVSGVQIKEPQEPQTEVPYAEENTEYVGDVAKEVMKQKTANASAKGKAAQATNEKTAAVTGDAVSATTPAAKSVAADKALGWLKNGNTRYVKRRVRADGQAPADRSRLLKGEAPHSIVFTCSDSRVPPEIIFDQKLGEIFVVRTATLAADAGVLASIEKGAALGAQLLVVLSHAGCTADPAKLSEVEQMSNVTVQRAVYDLKSGVVKFQ